MTSDVLAPPQFLAKLRLDFPILNRPLPDGRPLVYLDNAASAQKPQVVIDKLSEVYTEYYANTHRGLHTLGDRVTCEVEASREKIRHFLGASDAREIAFTAGTTASLNTIAWGWGKKFLRPGDEVLLTHMEHHANLVPWQQVARDTGAVLRFIPLTPAGELDLTQLDDLLSPRTKVLSVTAMSNVLGTVNPLAELCAAAHRVGALCVVDAAQSVPHLPVDVVALDVDFLAFSGHKLYGPSGIGVLYGKRAWLERMDPFLTGGNMIQEVTWHHATWAEPPAKFEAGTLAIAPAIALGTALDYVREVGFERIQAWEHHLTCLAYAQLQALPGVTILGPPPDKRGAIVTFVVDTVHPHDLADIVNGFGVAIRAGHHCTMPLHEQLGLSSTARASFAFYNTEAEIDTLVAAVQAAQRKFQRA